VKCKASILAVLVVMGSAAYLGSRLRAQQPESAAPTRIAMVNMTQVVKNYRKAQNLEAELHGRQQYWENKLKPLREQVCAFECGWHRMPSPAEREQAERNLRQMKREWSVVEDNAKKDLEQVSGAVYTQIYRDVEDAVNRFAGSNGYDVVLFYNDATPYYEKYSVTNVSRNPWRPFAMPLYIAPQVDITASTCNDLNSVHPPSAANTPMPEAPGQNGPAR
jgi:Skp family chaperone for outer membrane proteins